MAARTKLSTAQAAPIRRIVTSKPVATSLATLVEAESLSEFSRYTWRFWAQTGRVSSCRILGRTMIPTSEIARVLVETRARQNSAKSG
jgi:hypothetical protein